MNTRTGDSCAMLCEVLAHVRRYFAQRRVRGVRVRAIHADALPIVTIAYQRPLDRLDGADYLGTCGGLDQYVLRLKGFSVRWDRPRAVHAPVQSTVKSR